MSEQEHVKVITSDKQTLEVNIELMKQAGVFRQMYEDLNLNSDKEGVVFPVNFSADVMKKVIQWMEMQKGREEPVVTEDPLTRERKWFNFTEEETKFFDVSVEELIVYITAGNYLDLKSLYLFGCQTFAGMLKNQTPEQIRDMLHIEDDLTQEEKDQIRRDNVWCSY